MSKQRRAPTGLSPTARAWWKSVVDVYELSEHDIPMLSMAAQSLDRFLQARDQIAKDGIVVLDRYGCQKRHPALSLERDSQLTFLRCVRSLRLESDDDSQPMNETILRAIGE